MIPKASFGRSGHKSTRMIFGAYALSNATQKEADQVLELLLEYGINHIDVAPMYGNAEKCIGPWMERQRADFFLATKTRKRLYKEAWADLQRSLNTLRVDYLDLWQLHALTNPLGQQRTLGEGGALQALIEARDKGLVRFLGVTGHGNHVPEMHLRSLEYFDFDTVMLPYNFCQMQNNRYANTFSAMLRWCGGKNIAVQTILSIARRPWGTRPRVYNTFFYEPLETPAAIEKSMHWAMGLPDSFVISPGDIQLLPQALQAASCFEDRPTDDEMASLMVEYDIQPVFPGW
jgi:aryl-alcohol dehydrogenase-like predicted oxidoreductase